MYQGLSLGQVRFEQVEPALGRWIDHRRLDRMQRALRERRERAHLLDLVAPELDPKRFAAGGREHVDEPAAHSELAALIRTLDPLLARQGERLGSLLQTDIFAGLDSVLVWVC